MKRRKIVIAATIIVCMAIIILLAYKGYQQEKRWQERMEAIHRNELSIVVLVTSGKEMWMQDDDFSPEFDAKYVIMQVALYNECIAREVQKGEKISGYMEVQEEYDDFMSGRKTLEECRAINALFNFEHAENCYGRYENTEQGITYDYEDYIIRIGYELGVGTGGYVEGIGSHTNSEVEAASEVAAKKWCDYMEGK